MALTAVSGAIIPLISIQSEEFVSPWQERLLELGKASDRLCAKLIIDLGNERIANELLYTPFINL